MSTNRKPHRKRSRYHQQWKSGGMALDFAADDFAFADARTSGSLALAIGQRVVVSESANEEQLAYAANAGARLQAAIAARRKPAPVVEPMILRRLPLLLPARTTFTSAQYKASARTLDDHERFLAGCVERAEANRKQKATLLAVA